MDNKQFEPGQTIYVINPHVINIHKDKFVKRKYAYGDGYICECEGNGHISDFYLFETLDDVILEIKRRIRYTVNYKQKLEDDIKSLNLLLSEENIQKLQEQA